MIIFQKHILYHFTFIKCCKLRINGKIYHQILDYTAFVYFTFLAVKENDLNSYVSSSQNNIVSERRLYFKANFALECNPTMTVKFAPLLTSSYRENIANQEKEATKGLLRTVLEDFKAHSGTE